MASTWSTADNPNLALYRSTFNTGSTGNDFQLDSDGAGSYRLMGDSGSLFAGTILATLSLKTAHKASLGIALMIPLIFLAIPVMDTVLSFFRRLVKGKNPFKGDDDHIHHRLMKKGFSEKKSATILLILTAVFSILSILVSNFRGTPRFVALVASLMLGVLLMLYLNYININFKRKNGTKPPENESEENAA